MQQLSRFALAAVVFGLLSGLVAGCGEKAEDGPVPKAGGKRMSFEEAEKIRPKKKGSESAD
ncbi:hypothetical protein EON79_08075 [bacterium]|nr:MAG: hypothetical protein EON79_08075 [bacterium]